MGPPSEDGGNFVDVGEDVFQASRASMGPPSEDGGNHNGAALCLTVSTSFNGAAVRGRRKSVAALGSRFNSCELQWGRRPRTAEIPVPSYGTFQEVSLQWGRRPRTAEIACGEVKHDFLRCASMGPPSEDGGNSSLQPWHLDKAPCFNGAAVRGRRKCKTLEYLRAQRIGFNGAAVRGRRKSGSSRVRVIAKATA